MKIMKQVRFDTPTKSDPRLKMNNSVDCHSPRPFLASRANFIPPDLEPNFCNEMPLKSDPVAQYERSNCIPYPNLTQTQLNRLESFSEKVLPSSDLELSMFDGSPCDSPLGFYQINNAKTSAQVPVINRGTEHTKNSNGTVPILTAPVNYLNTQQESVPKDKGFFLRPDQPINSFMTPSWLKHSLRKDNPLKSKEEIVKTLTKPFALVNTVQDVKNSQQNHVNSKNFQPSPVPHLQQTHHHHPLHHSPRFINCCMTNTEYLNSHAQHLHGHCIDPQRQNCCQHHITQQSPQQIQINGEQPSIQNMERTPQKNIQTAEDKSLAIEKYEQRNAKTDLNNGSQKTVPTKEKREPTVTDLFKIIKLQNQQLKILQEKVDSVLNLQHNLVSPKKAPAICNNENFTQEVLQTVEEQHQQISIGVMTSFEMIRTSTVINNDIPMRNQNSVQCNRSQLSMREVISMPQQAKTAEDHRNSNVHITSNENFLEGIKPVDNDQNPLQVMDLSESVQLMNLQDKDRNEEKTFNELSLCNLQIDNATTPQLSPDQTLYLDVRDYSDSDSDPDQSNVRWTYYNKVMTHVNGMLQDSQIPSSAGALYRKAGRCARLHVDRTDVSITCKRVQFGDTIQSSPQYSPHLAPHMLTTDTSMKMNELAAKYLNINRRVQKRGPGVDMSLATQNYMRQHHLIPGGPPPPHPIDPMSPPVDMPTRFLDITALKQQPKLL